ncbi:hypothetical protein [Ruegeria arenilitoris]|uniref:hypothetical protein n=1 Tax=Ruegeria arenilitoris TaxID=1173585 RepID=UPI00147CB702|nr:hypothetical protein [Ruegeria arenilitoris]
MDHVTGAELARQLNLSRVRITQYVKEGKLDGCYEGAGRQRRFDLRKSAAALGKNLDLGQSLGNGAKTQEALTSIGEAGPAKLNSGAGAERLPPNDDDGYRLARAQKAVEEARKMRRQNAEEEGTFVLASDVALETKKLLRKEIAEFESVLKDGARQIADELGVDFKQVRAILRKKWREHQGRRSKILSQQADQAEMSEAELKADV